MDHVALRTLIDGLAADHPARVAFGAGNDSACAAVLNERTEPGHIPRRHLVVTLARHPQVDGFMKWVITFGTMPALMGGGVADFGLYCLFQSVSRIAANDVGVLLVVADLDAAIPQVQPLIDLGALPLAFFDELKGGEVKLGVAETALGSPVGIDDIAKARNL